MQREKKKEEERERGEKKASGEKREEENSISRLHSVRPFRSNDFVDGNESWSCRASTVLRSGPVPSCICMYSQSKGVGSFGIGIISGKPRESRVEEPRSARESVNFLQSEIHSVSPCRVYTYVVRMASAFCANQVLRCWPWNFPRSPRLYRPAESDSHANLSLSARWTDATTWEGWPDPRVRLHENGATASLQSASKLRG